MKLFLVTERYNRVRRTFHVSVPRQGPSGTGTFSHGSLRFSRKRPPSPPKDKYLRALHYALWNIFCPSLFPSLPSHSPFAYNHRHLLSAAWQILPGPCCEQAIRILFHPLPFPFPFAAASSTSPMIFVSRVRVRAFFRCSADFTTDRVQRDVLIPSAIFCKCLASISFSRDQGGGGGGDARGNETTAESFDSGERCSNFYFFSRR